MEKRNRQRWLTTHQLECKRCGELGPSRESRDQCLVLADRQGWCVTDKRNGAAVCPLCMEEADDANVVL